MIKGLVYIHVAIPTEIPEDTEKDGDSGGRESTYIPLFK